MHSVVSIEIKHKQFNPDTIKFALQSAYNANHDLYRVIENSSFYRDESESHSIFFFAYQNGEYLILTYKAGDDLRLHIEQTRYNCDLLCLYRLTNEVYSKVQPYLNRLNIQTGKAEAVVFTGQSEIIAKIPDRLSRFYTELKKQKFRLIFLPLAMTVVGLVNFQFNIVEKGDSERMLINAIIQVTGYYFAVILWFAGEILFAKKSQKFDF